MSASIISKTARDKLPPRREPYFARIRTGVYVGFRKLAQGDGTWIARRRNESGKQEYHAIGAFEHFDDAVKVAREWASAAEAGISPTSWTVKDACEHYVKHLELHKGKASKADADGRFKRLIYDTQLAKVELSALRTAHVTSWLSKQIEIGDDDAEDEDDLRRAKDSANRNLASFKAALNRSLHDRYVLTDAGWKTVAKFADVGRRRQSFLPAEQRATLIQACGENIRELVKAMLYTGARPGELANASSKDFDIGQGTLTLDGKTGHRVVSLSTRAIEFFEHATRDKIGNAPIFTNEFGQRWTKDLWKKPFKAAVTAAGLPPTVVMYSLRHTAISEMIAHGLDSFEVARMAGTSSEMIDKHYGHLRHDRMRAKLDAVGIL
ncbi:tyrosine-type recombinase/integrase [Paraburkholderia caribensis]|uniref:tyrosine-type recombinase/integrase n=1 Tax=Paraburkholderia caribensis TaxID=75105 RepID=UPI0007216457|nr:site-specific integrase [Paraburkholderia caribensis]ALP61589.1 integrase [Paraburkholderia caribensis]AUT53187.1 site-specific integrase [Paraburkholderia caribensis]